MKEVTLIAHRGLSSEAPENTLAAFRKAIELNFPYFELDVRLSKDGVPMVIHDATLKRVSSSHSKSAVAALTCEELKQYDVGHWFSGTFQGERIPTLLEVLALPRKNTGIMIELKELGENNPKLAAAAVSAIHHCMSGSFSKAPLVVASFSHQILAQVKKLDSRIPLMGLADNRLDAALHQKNGLNHLGLNHSIVSSSLIATLHRTGCTVWCYTVDSPRRAESLCRAAIDGIISNRPHLILSGTQYSHQ